MKRIVPISLLTLPYLAFSQINDTPVSVSQNTFCVAPSTGIDFELTSSQSEVNYAIENSGNIVAQMTGNGGALTINAPITESGTYVVRASSSNSECIDFDGYNQYLTSSHSSAMDYTSGFTLEAWVNFIDPSSTSYEPIFHIGDAISSKLEVYIRSNDLFVLFNRGEGTQTYATFPQPNLSQWTHIALAYSPSGIELFYDGVSQTPTSFVGSSGPTLLTPTYNLSFGSIINSAFPVTQPYQKHAEGKMDDIRFWNFPKSSVQVNAEMNSCLNGSEAGLISYYNFSNSTTTTITDQAGTTDATMTNMIAADDIVLGASNTCSNYLDIILSDTIEIEIIDIDSSVTVSGNIISAIAGYDSYQWYDCNNVSPITGFTQSAYQATTNGDYSVIINEDICSDTSECINIAGLTLSENNSMNSEIYPNPTNGQITISSSQPIENIRVMDITGKTVLKSNINTIDLSELRNGVYLVIVHSKEKYSISKVVKE